jgi:3-isopropylmalate/(R)-2-methylmalate dehydratase small subunit
MQPFTTVTGIAAPIDEANVDTNQLCPTRFNKVPRGPRYREILFYDQRVDPQGQRTGFLLDREPWDRARILVADANFGCGSSRETAVYALDEFGIRCVIAPSFGDIFFGNALQNGLLPVVLPEAQCAALRAWLEANPGARITADLESQQVSVPGGERYAFSLDPVRRERLLRGMDEIGLTLSRLPAIEAFEARYHAQRPWLVR